MLSIFSIFWLCYDSPDKNYGKTNNYLSLQQLKSLLDVFYSSVFVVFVQDEIMLMLMLLNGAQTSL